MRRLSELFHIKAKKNDGNAPQKSLLRRAKTFVAKALLVTVSAFALTAGAVHVFPGMASKPLDDHMKEMGLPPVSKHYMSENIRVLKDNAWARFAITEWMTRNTFGQTISNERFKNLISGDGDDLTAWQKIKAPFQYAWQYGDNYFNASKDKLDMFARQGKAAAYTLPSAGDGFKDMDLILPPKKADIRTYFRSYSDLDFSNVKLPGDAGILSKIFQASILCHEAQHCDQPSYLPTIQVEPDADLNGFRTLSAVYNEQASNAAFAEESLKNLRVINAACGFDLEHYSFPTLEKGRISGDNALGDMHQMGMLAYVLGMVRSSPEVTGAVGAFAPNTLTSYYCTKELLAEGFFDREYQGLKPQALQLMRSVEHFDGLSNGTILNDKEFECTVRDAVKHALIPLRPQNAQPTPSFYMFTAPTTLKPGI